MTKSVLSRFFAIGVLASLGLLSCDRNNPMLASAAASDQVTLVPRFATAATVPVVDSVQISIKFGQDSVIRTVRYVSGDTVNFGNVKPGDAFVVNVMGFDSSGGNRVVRWLAFGQGIAGNSASVQAVNIALDSQPDTTALSKLTTVSVGGALNLATANGQTAWYTTDGSDPRTPGKGTMLTTAVVVKATDTLRLALRLDSTSGHPAIWSAVKTIAVTAAKPVVNVPTFSTTATWLFADDSIVVTGTAGDVFRYTTNETDPDSNSAQYTRAIKFTSDTLILKAIAMASNVPSPVVSDTFYRARRDISTYGIPWNDTKTYDSLLDQRDGHVYRTVKIGSQTWMAENLVYAGAGINGDTGICYTNAIGNCAKFGRLYTWSRAMGMDTSANHSLIAATSAQGVCPQGWQIPSRTQWETLASELGGLPSAGAAMRSSAGWSGTSTDAFGFRALLAGGLEYNPTAIIMTSGFNLNAGHWWSYDAASAYEIRVSSSSSVSSLGEYVAVDTAASLKPLRRNFYSVRCVKN